MDATLETLVETFCLERADYDYHDKPHADLWCGGGVNPSLGEHAEGYYRLDGWLERKLGSGSVEEVDGWGDFPYRVVWRVPSLRAHVTHCEGDVTLLVARSDADYAAINRSAAEFYEKDYC